MKEEFIDFIKKHPISILLITAAILYILWIWLPLGLIHSWNEAYYMMRVTHVAEGGSYLDGSFDNPPLFVYSLSLLSRITGISLIAFRFVIVFCTLITTYLIYQIGCIFGKKRVIDRLVIRSLLLIAGGNCCKKAGSLPKALRDTAMTPCELIDLI